MRRLRAVLGGPVILFLAASGAIAADAPAGRFKLEKPAIKLGISVPSVGHLPLHVADAKGFLKAEGLEVQLVQFQSDSAAAQALTAGAVDLTAGSISVVIDSYVGNRDLITFWSASNLPGFIWYGGPKLQSIKELKGKGRIGISRLGSLSHRISAWAVAQAGLDPDKDVQYIQVGGPMDRVAALKAGQVDLIPATPPGTFLLDQEGFKPLLQLKDILSEFTFETLYARRGFVSQHPETIKAVLRSWIRGIQWAKQNRDETTHIVMTRLGAKVEDRELYRRAVDTELPYLREDGRFAERSVDVMLQFQKDQGRLKDLPRHSAFTDYSFIEYFERNPVR